MLKLLLVRHELLVLGHLLLLLLVRHELIGLLKKNLLLVRCRIVLWLVYRFVELSRVSRGNFVRYQALPVRLRHSIIWNHRHFEAFLLCRPSRWLDGRDCWSVNQLQGFRLEPVQLIDAHRVRAIHWVRLRLRAALWFNSVALLEPRLLDSELVDWLSLNMSRRSLTYICRFYSDIWNRWYLNRRFALALLS